jgi:hypothetical protein
MNMLYDMKDNLKDYAAQESSALKKWLLLNGSDTVEKFRQYEENGFDKPLLFSG